MGKTLEEYRNIVKILKLMLLKIREQNASLSQQLGISLQSANTSFSPKIERYKKSNQSFAKNVLIFLSFAHHCELIGVTPEMIFRIADKKRDKQVSVGSMTEVMKRLKLRMSETEIDQLLRIITKTNQIGYQEYLQYLSAFQINAEKFPAKHPRTYVQLCLLNFCKASKPQAKDAENLYRLINKGDSAHCSFDDFKYFVQRNLPDITAIELVAVFVSLDIQSECQIQDTIFKREITKVLTLLEKGINDDVYEPESKAEPTAKKTEKQQVSSKEQKKQAAKEEDYEMQEQTGVEAGAAKGKAAKKPVQKKVELGKGESKKIIQELKKNSVRVEELISRLLASEKKTLLVKSFSLQDFSTVLKELNAKIDRKKSLELFRLLDTEVNGTIDTMQLLKLWLRGKEVADSDQVLYKLLYRHFREIQYSDPLLRFTTLGIAKNETITESVFAKAFEELKLEKEEIAAIMQNIGSDVSVDSMATLLKNEGKAQQGKVFKKMQKKQFQSWNGFLGKILSKRGKSKESKKFRKLVRLETGQKSQQETYWDSIFTDEWACFQFCLQTALKLESFWRDSEFGPTKGDPHGFRSIVGNESDVPPGLPDQSQIAWLTFQELLVKQKNNKDKVTFMENGVFPGDPIQGKLGNCWFISALSITAKNESYIKGYSAKECRKMPENATLGISAFVFKGFARYGLYVFKFYKKFQPVYVVVDDLFPVESSSGELLFAKSPDAGKQWVAFVEKAYAKLHHCYSNMISGDISQGLNDLTNSLPIKEAIQPDKPDSLEKFTTLNNEEQLMGCSISAAKGEGTEAPVTLDGEKCGLLYGHAYSVLDVLTLRTKKDKQAYDLMRLRNPWGFGEWLLDWSDSPEDPDYKKIDKYQSDLDEYYRKKQEDAVKYGLEKPQAYTKGDDGQFLMTFTDFTKVYTNLFTGYNFKKKHQCLTISEKWSQKTPSGICSMKNTSEEDALKFVRNNHQYILNVKKDDTDFLMYIIQEDGRLYRGEKYPYKALCNGAMILCFKLDDKESSLDKFDSKKLFGTMLKFELRREVNFWRKLPRGKYAIIPCKMKNSIVDSDFQFRVYSDEDIDINKIKPERTILKPQLEYSTDIDKASVASLVDFLESQL